MSIAVDYRAEAAAPGVPGQAGRIAHVDVLTDMAAAEPYWRRLARENALTSPYQRYDLLAAWQHRVGEQSGVTPFLVVGRDAEGEPLFLWPLGRTESGPLRILRFLGSKHANFNIGLWRRDVVGGIGADDIRGILARLAARRVDLLVLLRQPVTWDGIGNPLTFLSRRPSAEDSSRLDLSDATGSPVGKVLSASTRGRLRGKERKLQKLAGYRYLCATTADDIDRLLDSFFALKARHMAAQGLDNVFAEAGVGDFLREACHRTLPDGRRLIELHALEGDSEVLALFGTIVDRYRASCMFNTYTLGEHARHSPGLVLLTHMIDAFAGRGIYSFDIGVGRAHYKSLFCTQPEPLCDTFLPLSPLGRLAAAALGTANVTKRVIKQNQLLWAGVRALRRVRARG